MGKKKVGVKKSGGKKSWGKKKVGVKKSGGQKNYKKVSFVMTMWIREKKQIIKRFPLFSFVMTNIHIHTDTRTKFFVDKRKKNIPLWEW